MYKIIKLSRRNFEEILEIDYESEHEADRKANITKAQMRKYLDERFNKTHEIFFGYRENGILKGYVTMKPFFPGHKHCEIYWLAVRKLHQGKGIGTTLMSFIEKYAKKRGFRSAYIYTNKTMKKTRKFYEKSGYRLVNEFPGYYGYSKNNTAVLYRKML